MIQKQAEKENQNSMTPIYVNIGLKELSLILFQS